MPKYEITTEEMTNVWQRLIKTENGILSLNGEIDLLMKEIKSLKLENTTLRALIEGNTNWLEVCDNSIKELKKRPAKKGSLWDIFKK